MDKLQKGDVISELEGHDFGDEGAVVVKVRDDVVDLVVVDTNETITVSLDDLAYAMEPKIDRPEIESGWYDEDAMQHNPELHDIRVLPTYWGPRDPNMPSTLTDVTWRPQNHWRRWQQRYYQYDGGNMRRRALYPALEPAPQAAEGNPNDQYHRDSYVPVRPALQRWSQDDALLPLDDLLALTELFWRDYWKVRNTYMPGRGNRKNLRLEDWGLMFQQQNQLDRSEMVCLYGFMVETGVVPKAEADQFLDLVDTFAVRLNHYV